MAQLMEGGRQPRNREERSFFRVGCHRKVTEEGWDEPCKLRGLRTVLWAAGGEIPPADPATVGFSWNSLDSLDRNEPFQRVTGDLGRIFSACAPPRVKVRVPSGMAPIRLRFLCF